jgi:general secretion pathway protein G
MTTCSASPARSAAAERGFTLVEVIVVLGVLAVLLGTTLPLVGAFVDGTRRQEVESELERISLALEEFYFDRGTFPASLDEPGFYGTCLQPGVRGTGIFDGWGGDVEYVYARTTDPDTASVHSRGENGIDDGYAAEEFKTTVYGAVPGLRRTHARMRVIVEALANFLEVGGTLTGNWSTDRQALGLGAEYARDGFGTDFVLDATTKVLRSAGPDRTMNNADDVTT